ncbi:MAG: DUF2007 domain-containing protein [Eubacterium sp.]|nr:DUF2007 domain-containing protein [Eubacterium sp.]
MKQLYVSTSEPELKLVEGLLKSEGIEPQIFAGGAGDYLRVLGADYSIAKSVVVQDQDYEKAKQLLEENGYTQETQKKINGAGMMIARIIIAIIVLIVVGCLLYYGLE